MAEHPELSAQERAGKAFPVSWDQFHRDCRALTWRLNEVGPFHAVIAITRGGLVPAAIVARELGVRVIDTVCIASYDHTKQGDLKVLKGVSADTAKLGGGTGNGLLIVDDLVDTGKTARDGATAGRYLYYRSVAGHLDILSVGYCALVPAADPRRRGVILLASPRRRGEGAEIAYAAAKPGHSHGRHHRDPASRHVHRQSRHHSRPRNQDFADTALGQ